jgi:hypothetical protein
MTLLADDSQKLISHKYAYLEMLQPCGWIGNEEFANKIPSLRKS